MFSTSTQELIVFGGSSLYGLSPEMYALECSVDGAESWTLATGGNDPFATMGAAAVIFPTQLLEMVFQGQGYYGFHVSSLALGL